MKRVLIFSLAYYPHVGGAEVSVKEITDRINPRDIEFHMVTLRFSATEEAEEHIGNVKVFRILESNSRMSKFLFQFAGAYKAHQLHKKYHYDATWALMAHSAGVPAGIFKLLHPQVPYLLNLQEGDPISNIERTMRPLWPLFTHSFKVADIVQPLSHFLAEWARKRGYNGPTEIIPNGADIAHFTGVKTPHEGIALVTTSRLVQKNAVDDVIRALTFLPEHTTFTILGIGPEEANLRKLALELGVENRVIFAGHVAHTDMPKYLHAADIYVRPSRSEGMGASFIEAMAAKLPVVATQEGGIADFLYDAKRNPEQATTGWAVDKNSPEQIATAVKNILDNPVQTKIVVSQAYEMVSQKYSWDLIAKTMREKVFAPMFNETIQ